MRELIRLEPYKLYFQCFLTVFGCFKIAITCCLWSMASRVKACKNTVVYYLFLGVLRQNEYEFYRFKERPTGVCLFTKGMYFRTKSIPHLLLLSFEQKKY